MGLFEAATDTTERVNLLDLSGSVRTRRVIRYWSAVVPVLVAVLLGFFEASIGIEDTSLLLGAAFCGFLVWLVPAIAASRGINWGVAVIMATVTVALLAMIAGMVFLLLWSESIVPAIFLFLLSLIFLLPGLQFVGLSLLYIRIGDRRLLFPEYRQAPYTAANRSRLRHNFKIAPVKARTKALILMVAALPAAVVGFLGSYVLLDLFFDLVGNDRAGDLQLILAAGFVAVTCAWLVIRYALRHVAPSADATRSEDQRPPIMLLRSFRDEDTRIYRFGAGVTGQIAHVLFFLRSVRLDELLHRAFQISGPVIAIGRPGQMLSPLGAAREYLPDAQWQSTVDRRIREAQLVVAILGETEGLAWEISTVLRSSDRNKLVLVVPPNVSEREKARRWEHFSKALDTGFEPPGNAVVISWHDGAIDIFKLDTKYHQVAGYCIALAWALDMRAKPPGQHVKPL
jgi:hypothetical protein